MDNPYYEPRSFHQPALLRPRHVSVFQDARTWVSVLSVMPRQRSRYGLNRVVSCDVCHRYCIGPRLSCIICRDEILSDGIDFCSGCIGRDAPDSKFPHSSSHTLLRNDYRLQIATVSWTYTEARLVSTRVKAEFRELQLGMQNELNREKVAETTREPASITAPPADIDSAILCACCGKAVTTPCWACLHCGEYETNI